MSNNHNSELNGSAKGWPHVVAGAGIAAPQQSTGNPSANPAPFSGVAAVPRTALQPQSWSDRVVGETTKAFTAFVDYCELGVQRSIRKLHQLYVEKRSGDKPPLCECVLNTPAPPTASLGTLFDWSKTFDWPRRAALFDEEEFVRRRVAFAEARSQRQRQVEQEQWDLGAKMLRLANEVLDEAGKFTTTKRRVIPAPRDRQGRIIGPEREIITVGIKAEAAIRAGEKAVELMRQAVGLPLQDLRVPNDIERMGNPHLEESLTVQLCEQTQDAAPSPPSTRPRTP